MKTSFKEYPSAIRTNIRSLKPSATLEINELSQQLIADGNEVYRLGFGQSPFPVPTSVVRALQENAGEKDYLPVKGLATLREAVAAFNRKKLNISCTARDILIGPGSKELIFNLQMAYEGVLLLPSPSWVSYEPQAEIAGKAVAWIPTRAEDGWRLQADDLETACLEAGNQNKLLILNYPNNPTGTSYNGQQLQALARVLKKHKILVIADEIYGEVHHHNVHQSMAAYYPEGTIISGGLSKWCGAGGWRLGTFSFPPEYQWLLEAMAKIASETYSAVSAPIQYAAVTAFRGNEEIEMYLRRSRRILEVVGNFVYRNLSASGLKMSAPDGGFYLFPDFVRFRKRLAQKDIHTSQSLCGHLLRETKVALLPGSAFGRPDKELTVRLAYVDFNGTQLLQLFEHHSEEPTDEDIIRYCPHITAAVKALALWCGDYDSTH